MDFPDFSLENKNLQWQRFCDLQWYSEKLGFWLDVSRMHLNSNQLISLEKRFTKAFEAIQQLEKGEFSNIDENRQVGHYWLRNNQLAPSVTIKESIADEIDEIECFSQSILSSELNSFNNEKFTDVIWIGIGGSSLGPVLLINALASAPTKLRFHFLDNVDPDGISDTLNNLDDRLKTTLFVVVSKSGGTPEPRITMDQIRNKFESIGGPWNKHAIAITMKGSKLDLKAQNENWLASFDCPIWVGGRTSITSAVGLLPACLTGIDIRKFLSGSSLMDEYTRNQSILKNPAALLASVWYFAGDGKGLKDMVVLPYKDKLEVFSRYLQQLVMESLGKEYDRSGQRVNQGIAVYGNKGSTDQHAYVQQLRDGIDNFFVTFVEVLKDSNQIPQVNGDLPGDYLSGFLHGTRDALSEGGRQSITLTLNQLDAESLGALIALFERAVGLYAELINVNAYNQPGVEAGKNAAADLLKLQDSIIDLLSDNKKRSLKEICLDIPHSSIESTYLILRHLIANNKSYNQEGNISNPSGLIFYKTNKLY